MQSNLTATIVPCFISKPQICHSPQRGSSISAQAMYVPGHIRLQGEIPLTPQQKHCTFLLQGIALRLHINVQATQSKKAAEPLFSLSVPLLSDKIVIQFYKLGALRCGTVFSDTASSFKFKSVFTFCQALSISLSE